MSISWRILGLILAPALLAIWIAAGVLTALGLAAVAIGAPAVDGFFAARDLYRRRWVGWPYR